MKFDLATYFENITKKGDEISVFGLEYLSKHRRRFEVTNEMLKGLTGSSALEIGATDFYQLFLAHNLGFENVWGTIFSGGFTNKIGHKTFSSSGYSVESTTIDIQLENELFPLSGPTFDLVLLCEVIEHFDVDPMFCLIELNRIMNTGGKLLITTPNICSARNVHKICLGHRPHFFMQYQRDRSPYRHNFEYDIHALLALTSAAGFQTVKVTTEDVFEAPCQNALSMLKKQGFPTENRGDDIFLLVEKKGPPKERWPEGVYV